MLADFGTGQVLWSMMWFFFFFVYIWVVIAILTDIFRDHEMGGVAKAIWIIALVLVPLVTGIVYLIVRGSGMSERAMKQAERQRQAMDEYIRQTAAPAGPADQIAQAQKLLDAGTITQDEFSALKTKALLT